MGHKIPEAMDPASRESLQQVPDDDDAAPESWEADDVVERMKKLLPPSLCIGDKDELEQPEHLFRNTVTYNSAAVCNLSENAVHTIKGIEQVDSFLRDALQNSRDRLTILRLEKEVERFMRNRQQQVLEFQPMASSYLRLVAHRVAQHYNLKSMVIDCNTPEGTRIIAQKTHESRFPAIRLADIPVKQSQDSSQNLAIKARPHKGMTVNGESNSFGNLAGRLNPTKSVEERKKEYNEARARIFSTEDLFGKTADENQIGENSQNREVSPIKYEEKWVASGSIKSYSEGFFTDGSDIVVDDDKAEGESALRGSLNTNRVAIFRDREKDRKDPDYDRSYDRYMQRFDPGFGINSGPTNIQAIYAPLTNYNSEFPHLAPSSSPQVHVDHQQHSRTQQIQGGWIASNLVSYRPVDPMMGPFNLGHMSGMYIQTPQFSCPRPSTSYVNASERFQRPFLQAPMQHEMTFSQARRQ